MVSSIHSSLTLPKFQIIFYLCLFILKIDTIHIQDFSKIGSYFSYWILYLSIIAGGSSSQEFNGLEVIFKLKGPETDILPRNKMEEYLPTYFWDHHQNRVHLIDIEITHYPIKIVTYPFGIGHIGHEGMCWNIKVFFVCFDPTSLCHMLHPSAPNIPIFTDLWPHFSYCATFHLHIVKFRLYGNT